MWFRSKILAHTSTHRHTQTLSNTLKHTHRHHKYTQTHIYNTQIHSNQHLERTQTHSNVHAAFIITGTHSLTRSRHSLAHTIVRAHTSIRSDTQRGQILVHRCCTLSCPAEFHAVTYTNRSKDRESLPWACGLCLGHACVRSASESAVWSTFAEQQVSTGIRFLDTNQLRAFSL